MQVHEDSCQGLPFEEKKGEGLHGSNQDFHKKGAKKWLKWAKSDKICTLLKILEGILSSLFTLC